MPFKVVQTRERGKKFLSCVPDGWESDGTLYWPKTKAEKLSKIEHSTPGDDWISMLCEVKRDNLTYHEAQLQITIMSDYTDTEEDVPKINFDHKRSKAQKKVNVGFNDLAEKCLVHLKTKEVRESEETSSDMRQTDSKPLQESALATSETKSSPIHRSESVTPHIYVEPTHMQQKEDALLNPPVLIVQTDQPQSSQVAMIEDDNCSKYYIVNDTQEAEDNVSRKLDSLTAAVVELKQTQQQILLGIASISTQIEEFFKRSKVGELNEKLQFQPITNLESLQKLENDLKDGAGVELKKKLSVVCGSGKGRGANNCFALIDVMFNRKFLTECSWAGGSRDESKKICFKAFTGVIQLFFSIIHDSDNNFTLLECEKFFKNILRNSVRRNAAKLQRASATKQRKIKSKNNKVISNETPASCSKDMQQNTLNENQHK